MIISPHTRQWGTSENEKAVNGQVTGLMVILYGKGKGRSDQGIESLRLSPFYVVFGGVVFGVAKIFQLFFKTKKARKLARAFF